MPIVNYKTREINCKIVYVGPSLGGKTTNIRAIHAAAQPEHRTELQCINTEGDRTLFFDYFSLDIDEIQGYRTRFLIYGVPGQPYYKTTRKMVLNGADGLVFVADSERMRLDDNRESLADLKQMLREYGYNYLTIPLAMQWNKRDLPDTCSPEELDEALNDRGVPAFESIAIEGVGVLETFQSVCTDVIRKLDESLAAQFYSQH